MRGFVGDTLSTRHSRGFHHVDFDPDQVLSVRARFPFLADRRGP